MWYSVSFIRTRLNMPSFFNLVCCLYSIQTLTITHYFISVSYQLPIYLKTFCIQGHIYGILMIYRQSFGLIWLVYFMMPCPKKKMFKTSFMFYSLRHVASFLSVFKLLVIGLIIIGRDPFALFGMQAPGIWEWGQGNKVRFPAPIGVSTALSPWVDWIDSSSPRAIFLFLLIDWFYYIYLFIYDLWLSVMWIRYLWHLTEQHF